MFVKYGDLYVMFHDFPTCFLLFFVALVGPQDSNAPRVYAPSWMQRPMEAVRYMPSVATAQPSVPQAITQLQLPQGWVKSREKYHPGRYMYY